MAKYNTMKLMAHPLSRSLANQIFNGFGRHCFLIFFLLYVSFLGLFTALAIRLDDPRIYYHRMNITFTDSACEVVLRAVANITLDGSHKKQLVDRRIQIYLYIFLVLLLTKNVWMIFGFIHIHLTKVFTSILEIIAIVLSFVFVQDHGYQNSVTMRCPIQWQYGAFGIFIGYLGLLYYIQYFPVIGIYVIMLKIIVVQFIFFVPVLMCLLGGFGITFYMLLRYQNGFSDFASRALSNIGSVKENTPSSVFSLFVPSDFSDYDDG